MFQEHRGFTAGEGGLAFLGIGVGVVFGTALAPIQNRLYWRAMDKSESGHAPPEASVVQICGVFEPDNEACAQATVYVHGGCDIAPRGVVLVRLVRIHFLHGEACDDSSGPLLFPEHRTTFPSIHWIVPILGGVPLGTAIALILQSLTAYMMDTYTIYCASAIAATVLLRSVLAAAFPLFSPVMFRALGDQWASSVFAFAALAMTPVPILFWVSALLSRRRAC